MRKRMMLLAPAPPARFARAVVGAGRWAGAALLLNSHPAHLHLLVAEPGLVLLQDLLQVLVGVGGEVGDPRVRLLQKVGQVEDLRLRVQRAPEQVPDLHLDDLQQLPLLLGALLRAAQEPAQVAGDPVVHGPELPPVALGRRAHVVLQPHLVRLVVVHLRVQVRGNGRLDGRGVARGGGGGAGGSGLRASESERGGG